MRRSAPHTGGLKTLVIEKRALGGVCLNEGCIPTKTLLYSAKIFDYSKHCAEYGVKLGRRLDRPQLCYRAQE